MTINQRANRILAEIDCALALADKATPGPWVETQDDSSKQYSGKFVLQTNKLPYTIAEIIGYQSGEGHDAAFIAASRTLLPASLRCLKTAIDGLLELPDGKWMASQLTIICNQWDSK